MKRVCLLILAILIALSAAACRGTNDPGVIIDITDDTDSPSGSGKTDVPGTQTAPTEAPTADPYLTPAPTETPSQLPEGQVLWLNTMPLDMYGITMADAEDWFKDAVFIGDSIMLGWKNYNNKHLETDALFFGPTHFLCEGSYGAGHALEPVSDSSLHPIYQGQQRLLWDSVKMMGAKKVFICFGLNDVAIYGVEGTAENFRKVCKNITDQSPDAKIYIISSMYLINDANMKKLTNANLRALNELLRKLCNENGYKFVDIASHLVGPDGYLKAEYCSDNYVHQTNAAYDVWAKILRSLAAHEIRYGY
ncbi:MAG: hypothetical protein J5854_04800 [Clostridia bacterium]|nr:hypothetical protein [Clostridia bacterium]